MLFTEAQSSRAVVEKMATVGTISIRGTGGRPSSSSSAACRALNFVFSSDYLKNQTATSMPPVRVYRSKSVPRNVPLRN